MIGFEIITTIVGALIGGSGSALSKWIGIKEKKLSFEHEIKLLQMQIKAQQSETENELAITQEEGFAAIREASYGHDMATGNTSRWVNNILRLVRPILTIMLISLVWVIWKTVAKDNSSLQNQIIDGVLFMSSAALAWWFGDRSPHSKKLPWQ